MSNTTQTLVDMVNTFEVESEKFWNGNNTAGRRARKHLLEIARYAKTERKRIAEENNIRKASKTAS